MFFLVRDGWLQPQCSTARFPYATLCLLWGDLSVRAVFHWLSDRVCRYLDKGPRGLGSVPTDCRLSDRVPWIDHQLSEAAATYAHL